MTTNEIGLAIVILVVIGIILFCLPKAKKEQKKPKRGDIVTVEIDGQQYRATLLDDPEVKQEKKDGERVPLAFR